MLGTVTNAKANNLLNPPKLYDMNHEKKLIKTMIHQTMNFFSDTLKHETWKVGKKDSNYGIKSYYKIDNNNKYCYLRSGMNFTKYINNYTTHDYYDYLECDPNQSDANNYYFWDKNSTTKILKVYDSNHKLMHSRAANTNILLSSFVGINDRQFLFISTRFKKDNWSYKNNPTYKFNIVGSLTYSPINNNIINVDKYLEKDCVVGDIKYRGYVLVENINYATNHDIIKWKTKLVYISCFNPKTALVRYIKEAYLLSRSVDYTKQFVDSWETKMKSVQIRKLILLNSQLSNQINQINQIQDDEKKMNENIQQQIQSIKLQPNTSRDKIYFLAKKVYKKQGKPVIIDRKNVLNKIRQNARNYKNVALPLVLGRDKPFNQWNEYQFKLEFSTRFNIPIKCIVIKSVRAGSQIIDLKLETHSSGNKLLMPIECIAENISTEQAKKSLVEFGIFAMEFGLPVAGLNCLKQRVIMNPRWNKDYGPNGTNWDGALNDGKYRGNEPYYCPKGWKRFSIQFSKTAYDFNNVYDKWPIAYHGTKFHCSMFITLTGLRATGGDHGQGVYLSPSIRYVSHPRYCKPVKFDLSTAQQKAWTSEYVNEFKKYDNKWIQVAFACRVKPGSFIKGKETMGSWLPRYHIKNGKFDNIDINTIEWLVTDSAGTIVESDRILIYGIMIKVSDTETTGY